MGKKGKGNKSNSLRTKGEAPSVSEQTGGSLQEPVNEPECDEHSTKRRIHIPSLSIGMAMIIITILIAGVLGLYWWSNLKATQYFAKSTFSVITPDDTMTINSGEGVTVKSGQMYFGDGRSVMFSKDMMKSLTIGSVDNDSKEYAEPNKHGTKQYYLYSKKDDKRHTGFVFANDSTKKVKLSNGELLELSNEKGAGHQLFALGRNQIKPTFKLDKKVQFVQGDQYQTVHLSKLQVYGNLLMLNVDDTGDSNKVVIYPEFGNDPIVTISKNDFGKDMSAPMKDANNLTFRVACNNHVSSIAKADKIKIFYSPKAEAKGYSIWAIVFTCLVVLQLAGMWYLFKRKKNKTAYHGEEEAVNDEEPHVDAIAQKDSSAEEKELEEVDLRIEEFEDEKKRRRQRLDALPEDSFIPSEDTEKSHTPEEDEMSIYGASKDDKIKWVEEHFIDTETYDQIEEVKTFKNNLKTCSNDFEGRSNIILAHFETLFKIYQEKNGDAATDAAKITEQVAEDTTAHDMSERENVLQQQKTVEGNLQSLKSRRSALKQLVDEKKVAGNLTTIQNLRDQLKVSNDKLSDLQRYKDGAESRIRQAQDEAEQKVAKAKEEAQHNIEKANRKAESAREEARQTREQVTLEFKSEIDGLNSTITTQAQKISKLSSDLSATKTTLVGTEEKLESAIITIKTKEDALARFHKTIKEVDPAKEYAEQIEKLLAIGDKVEKSALKLSYKKDIDDYLIPKYIARFRSVISGLDMNVFTTDVFNAAKAQFVYKTQMLATFDIGNPSAFHQSMKMYFFDNYLKKYVDALVVLNETMIGSQYTVDGVVANDVKDFVGYRAELTAVLKALEVDVEYVKIMDKSDDNLRLTVIPKDLPDIDCPKNSICQMENCIVYLHGSDKPNEKIEVIVKN